MTAKDLQIRELKDVISEQKQLISSLTSALSISSAQSLELTNQIKILNEQLEFMKKKLFGTSSERRSSSNEDQLNIFNEVEVDADADADAGQSHSLLPLEILVEGHVRKPKKLLSEKLKGIPVEQIICDLEGPLC